MKETKSKSGALFVGIGIFLSRIAGLIRERAFAHFFGNSDAADAFKAALKIPNFLQNLFGEGVLSASFIPVYAKLLSSNNEDEKKEAQAVASTIFTFLFLLTSLLVLAGIALTPYLIDLIAPGFKSEKRELTIRLVQIFFPGTGLLVMSAWCLGILNSHRKFLLSYTAPVIWNLTIIAALFYFGKSEHFFNESDLAIKVAWGLVLGSLLQFLVQLPTTLTLIKKLQPNFNLKNKSNQTIIKNFFPVVISRGVIQVSAYVDSMIASLLPTGAVSALSYAQTIYLLPVSLFGMSISAAELPEMSSITGQETEIKEKLKHRLSNSLNRVTFFIIPSIIAFLFLGKIIISLLFQTGKFSANDNLEVWYVLLGSTVGLLASTKGRLYSSTFYVLKDTRTPLKFAIVRLIFGTILAYILSLHFLTFTPVMGISLASGISAWVEYWLLKKNLARSIGSIDNQFNYEAKVWISAISSGALAFFIFNLINSDSILIKINAIGTYGIFYFLITYFFKIQESKSLVSKILSKLS